MNKPQHYDADVTRIPQVRMIHDNVHVVMHIYAEKALQNFCSAKLGLHDQCFFAKVYTPRLATPRHATQSIYFNNFIRIACSLVRDFMIVDLFGEITIRDALCFLMSIIHTNVTREFIIHKQ